ncbi:DNA repair protein RecN [Ideonella dechloratans]|uniref:DNA repair protein RecN n=1 Tax=Ideonella dechloratans TaxID=36863 RepID=A0A643F7S7_IDEDE|nr:DNA repair protein RecN [Ideonella dechloratans]KAB0576396.1 DNA repair protein RecN [Ideonella dechloratans]UFU10892.1 DNA repair protein RecN [Ideonella dechloratans]
MLKHLTLKDFVIVSQLELAFHAGFSVLTGETGAGKSILIDALQLVLGARAESHWVREGAARAEVTAEFDPPPSLAPWLEEAGFAAEDTLLLRRIIDSQGKSRGFINGSAATAAQLREVADHLVDIHGQHAWQGLTRPAAVRALLDEQAGVDPRPLAQAHADWRAATEALAAAHALEGERASERERLQWQIGEIDRLAPGADEWPELNAEHQRLSHGQALMDAAALAAQCLDEDETSASRQLSRALSGLEAVADFDPRIQPVLEALQGAQAQVDDAARSLNTYLARAELDPDRLAELDARLSAWLGLARRFRRPPEELPALRVEWQAALDALDAASDVAALSAAVARAEAQWRRLAEQASRARQKAAPDLSKRVSTAMQQLGMAGGRFEVALLPQDAPQSFGLESVEFGVAGHAGSAPRPLAKVASGGELSRLALAIAVTTAQQRGRGPATALNPGTLIFDEIDSGVGGTVADAVGRLMKQLGQSVQVLSVTHLPQVAACADHHFVVAKATRQGQTQSQVTPVEGEARVAEVARMLGGASGTSLAHAQQLIQQAAEPAARTAKAAR